MELGSCFDDDLFESRMKLKNDKKEEGSYFPKICSSRWFNTVKTSSSSNEFLLIIKFQADNEYGKANFKVACKLYEKVLSHLGTTGTSLRRDCLEGVTRCLLKQHLYDEAIVWAQKLLKLAKNEEHCGSVYSILATIYRAKGQSNDEIVNLQKLISVHPLHYEYWLQLALAYSIYYKIPASFIKELSVKKEITKLTEVDTFSNANCVEVPSSVDTLSNYFPNLELRTLCPDDPKTASEEVDLEKNTVHFSNKQRTDANKIIDGSNKNVQLIAACLIRMRILIKAVENCERFISQLKTKRLLLQIESQLLSFNLPENFVLTAEEILSRDVRGEEDDNSEFQDLSKHHHQNEEPDPCHLEESSHFEKQWFQWLL